jgi:hypothetical protein
MPRNRMCDSGPKRQKEQIGHSTSLFLSLNHRERWGGLPSLGQQSPTFSIHVLLAVHSGILSICELAMLDSLQR